MGSSFTKQSPFRLIEITDHGAKCDCWDGEFIIAEGSTTVGIASGGTVSTGDIGKICCVERAAPGALEALRSPIVSINSPTSFEVASAAGSTSSNRRGSIGTDDTSAWRGAMDEATFYLGATIVSPSQRQSLINGAFIQPTGVKDGFGICQIPFPCFDLTTQAPIAISIIGTQAFAPNTNWTADAAPLSRGGAIIRSYAYGTDATYGVFGGGPPSGAIWNHTAVQAEFRGLILRTYNQPKISPLYLKDIGYCIIDGCLVDVGCKLQSVLDPFQFSYDSSAIVLPGINNWAKVLVTNADVVGYNNGVVINEHANLRNVDAWLNRNGFLFTESNHASFQKTLKAVGCTNAMKCTGSTRTHPQQINIEITDFGDWRDTVYALDDAGDRLTGIGTSASVISNVGPSNSFVKNGGTNYTNTVL